jgi:hypothetical protein
MKVTVRYMDEFRARRIMTPQQKALIAELRAADYPATWKLSASAADDKLVASGTRSKRQRALDLVRADGLSPRRRPSVDTATWLPLYCLNSVSS